MKPINPIEANLFLLLINNRVKINKTDLKSDSISLRPYKPSQVKLLQVKQQQIKDAEHLQFPDSQYPCEKRENCKRKKFCNFAHDSSTIRLMNWIEETKNELLICMYLFTSSDLSKCIEKLDLTKKSIKILTTNSKFDKRDQESLSKNDKIPYLKQLKNVEVRYSNKEQIMHNKFSVRDTNSVQTGSLNWTRTALFENDENVVIEYNPEMVRSFREQFYKLWNVGTSEM